MKPIITRFDKNSGDILLSIPMFDKDIFHRIQQIEKCNPSWFDAEHYNIFDLIKENQELKRNCNIGNENLNFYREENQQLKAINEQHRKINGKLREENQKLETEKERLNSLVNSCQEEIRRLKKQFEEYKDKVNWYENFEINKTIDKLRIRHNNQQKEFIEYMTKTIEELECDDVDDEELKGYLLQRIDTFKEILAKYKEIICKDINVGTKGCKDEIK